MSEPVQKYQCPKCAKNDVVVGVMGDSNKPNHCNSCGHEWDAGEPTAITQSESFGRKLLFKKQSVLLTVNQGLRGLRNSTFESKLNSALAVITEAAPSPLPTYAMAYLNWEGRGYRGVEDPSVLHTDVENSWNFVLEHATEPPLAISHDVGILFYAPSKDGKHHYCYTRNGNIDVMQIAGQASAEQPQQTGSTELPDADTWGDMMEVEELEYTLDSIQRAQGSDIIKAGSPEELIGVFGKMGWL